MAETGWILLFSSFVIVVFGSVTCLLRRLTIVEHSIATKTLEISSALTFVLLIASYLSLVWLFIADRFDVSTVYQYSEKSLSLLFKISATWSGMQGSLLFWTVNYVFFSIVALRKFKSREGHEFFFISLVFLTFMLVWPANPFRYVEFGTIPLDGLGLNPLLHNFYMLIHPVLTYIGLNSSIYLVLKSLSLDEKKKLDWMELLGWISLTSGIVLGGYWAYIELGWGGFWAWDPVENSSFVPWLIYTAYIHLYKYTTRKGLFLLTALAAHFFTVLGTFLTRTGLVVSVHAFSNSDVAYYLQWYVYFTLIYVVWALSNTGILSILSGSLFEKVMFLKWMVFIFYALSIIWGVLFGPLSEILFKEKIFLGIPFYESISLPYVGALLMILPAGIGIWSGTIKNKRALGASFVSALFVVIFCEALTKDYTVWETTFLSLMIFNTVFLLTGIGLTRNISRMLVFAIHLFFIVIAIGIMFSYSRKMEKNLTLRKNEKVRVFYHDVTFKGIEVSRNSVFEEVTAVVNVNDSVLRPSSRYYFKKDQLTAEVDIKKSVFGDFYIALVEIDENENWIAVKIFYSPFIWLVWSGTIGLLFSAILKKVLTV
ncbi:MAG: cytochrome c biogenesis protein CcsA [Deltaproteobacteria bacterium]|nr:cytochrome c biogenesis protein CcsA [Deltaproteobacteria bacterium]